MLVLRLLVILIALALVICLAMYLVTRDRRYLGYAGQMPRFTVLMLVVFALLYLLERYVLVGWRILF